MTGLRLIRKMRRKQRQKIKGKEDERMKKFTAMICTLALALSLTACGGSNDKEVSVDPAKLASELVETVTSDQLSETPSEMITTNLALEENSFESAVAYRSSATTSCEVAVLQAKDDNTAKSLEESLQSYVKSRIELYSTYNTDEADRLKDAIIKTAGTYTVLCVTDDFDKANEILKGYGF